ncbi:hypothetical protein [Sorangium sp. So ce341]|uniref:hypothetical protein n=1 Tax=Sorangium sp. So ce341 TaxID=3133302 RepID=UPI003F5F6396
MTIEPPPVSRCEPVSPVPALRRTNMDFIRACEPDLDFVATAFLYCYPPQENGECWDSYRRRREFPLYNDTRTCSPCSCSEPSRDKCRVQTTLYYQADCSEELGSVLISGLDRPLCTDTIDGQIGAVRSIFVKDEPTCTPSTDSKVVSGELEPGDTHVLCCNR